MKVLLLIFLCSMYCSGTHCMAIAHNSIIQQKKYEALTSTLGYDPEVKSFSAFRHIIFDHNKGEFGVEFLRNKKMTGYHHGTYEDGDYAFPLAVEGFFNDVYTFNFPKSSVCSTEQTHHDAHIALEIKRYIDDLYNPSYLKLFGNERGAAALMFLSIFIQHDDAKNIARFICYDPESLLEFSEDEQKKFNIFMQKIAANKRRELYIKKTIAQKIVSNPNLLNILSFTVQNPISIFPSDAPAVRRATLYEKDFILKDHKKSTCVCNLI